MHSLSGSNDGSTDFKKHNLRIQECTQSATNSYCSIDFYVTNFFKECAMKVVSFTHATLESSARTVIIDKILPIKTEAKIEDLSYEQLCEVCLDSFDDSIFSFSKCYWFCANFLQAVNTVQILDCLRELGFVICKVLFTYHSVLLFHIDEDERLECAHEKCGLLFILYHLQLRA